MAKFRAPVGCFPQVNAPKIVTEEKEVAKSGARVGVNVGEGLKVPR